VRTNNPPKTTPQAEEEKRQQCKPWHRNGQEAIFKVALKEYGGLGKLIHQGPYDIPSIPNKATYGSLDPAVDIDGINQTMYLEEMKGILQEDQGDGR